MKRPVTIKDFSAALTGVLLALNLPVNIPIWQVVFGSAVAIILVKQLFGGLGKNFANPAITARIVMFLAFSVAMTTGVQPLDGVSAATPLALLAKGDTGALPGLSDMFFGLHGGALGETCALARIIGGVFLIATRVISWHTPVTFIASSFLFTLVLGQDPVYHVLSGGLLLGAIFMATDYVTTPQTNSGRVVFGVGAGLLTVLFRVYGSFPEGVSFAILMMNILTPYINRFTENKPLGGVKP
jgi:electron transport complex protein RnfD